MTTTALPFWQSIDLALDTIEDHRPDTFDGVKSTLDQYGDPDSTGAPTRSADAAFFGGSGGDRSLLDSLLAAGWRTTWVEASYYYVARHPRTGETLTYVEGDVQRGDTALR